MGKESSAALKKPANALPSDTGKNVTTFEYICLMLARIGGMFGTTLTGTLATAFLHELYYGPVGVESDQIAKILAVQTTITTVAGIVFGLVAGVVVQKWKSRWGRYRQWYIICLVPIFALTVLYFWVPKGWSVQQMTLLRYCVACCQTVFNAFNNLGQNVAQVISPNHKEKKTVATVWQLSYYLGYGGAYLGTFVYGLFSDDKNKMYMTLAIVAAIVTAFGNLMCGLFCHERIELPKKEKVRLSKQMLTLFKYRNYRAYQYIGWANVLAALGKFSTLLAAITVGSSKNLLLTIPTAAGTVVGNLITAKISKKYEPTKLLKFCGPYAMVSAGVLFLICWAEAKALYDEGKIPPFADRRLLAEIRQQQEDATEDDYRVGLISGYLENKMETCILDLWKNALGNDFTKPSKKDSQELGLIMQSIPGWSKQDRVKRFPAFGVQRWWARETENLSFSEVVALGDKLPL